MDEGNLVILFNGFQKKTQKTPPGEIKRAKRIMDEYFYCKKMKGKTNNEELKARGCTPIEDLIAEDFGALGTTERNEFESGCEAFIIGEQLKAERLKASMTQEQLAARIGTKKSYISRIENGHADIQLSTLFKIFQGLGRKISFTIM